MMAKPIRALELHYPVIQFLINLYKNSDYHLKNNLSTALDFTRADILYYY